MKAMVITRPGGPEVLALVERPAPVCAAHEVRIRVHAAGLNRADLIQRQGRYPAPEGVPADIPGLEVAGVIESLGSAVARWQVGDRVCALLAGGGYAEQVVVDARHCLPIPDSLDFTAAAALPEVVFTVWSNVFQRGRLQTGETFLVHGGSSGIGMTAIQLAKIFGARVLATAGSDEKVAACVAAGADRAINYRETDFGEAFSDEPCDVILDMVGAEYLARNLALLRPEGRLVLINTMRGAKAEVNLLQVMTKRLTITGSTLRSRDAGFKAALAKDIERHVWPLLADGRLRPVIDSIHPLASAADAHRRMESSDHVGKLILAV